jgi:hypothetical protein
VATTRFFDDDGMDFATRCVLSGVRHGMSEVGEVLAATATIRDGDPDSWLETYVALGTGLRATAEEAAAAGHRHSAWNAALRAANYLFAGLWWAPVTRRAGESAGLWQAHREAWDLAVRHWPSPAWPVRIPHGDQTLPGHWFHARPDVHDPPPAGDEPRPRPVLVLLQGLNTPASDAPMTGLDGALARGYHVLVVDGPGQGAALHRQGLTLVPDWAPVVASLLDWLATRPEADPDRIVLSGVEHGSYFALSALAARPDLAVAALVVDPGALDLGADARAAVAQAGEDPAAQALLSGTTTEPTGTATLEEALAVLDRCRIDPDALRAVRTPTLVLDAEDAASFAGQGATLLQSMPDVAVPVVFTCAEGAGAECGLGASQIHDARVFDLLDDLLRTPGP